MWYDELGPVLEPLFARLASGLETARLAVWILRWDGRHFLEDPPPAESLTFLPGRGPLRPGVSPGSVFYSAFDPVEVVDPETPRERILVFESLYPSHIRPPAFHARVVDRDSPLYEFVDLLHPPVGEIELPPETLPHGSSRPGEKWWICRLEDHARVNGLVAIPSGAARRDIPQVFDRVWREQVEGWERLQMEASLARRTETVEAVQSVGNTITSQLEIHDILQSVVEQATVLMKAKIASLMLVDEVKQELVIESVYGSSPEYIRKPNLDINASLIGRVVRAGKPLMVHDVRTCKSYTNRELAVSEGLVSLLSVPLKWRDTCMGALNVYSARPYRYTEDGVYLLSMLASQCAIAIQNARTLQQAKALEEQVHDLDKRSVVGELAAGVAHEIRNPLAVVRMLIDSWEPADDTQSEDIKVISTQLHGINRCVTQLLETAGSKAPEFTQVEIAKEAPNILKLLRVRLRDQGVEACLDIPEGLSPISADASRLRQMLMNLLLNALNAMPLGGRIQVRASEGDIGCFSALPGMVVVPLQSSEEKADEKTTMVLFSLSDTGGGVEEADLREIFEPFKTKRPGGFGLGLSVVKRIVEEHGAALKVHNLPGEGLTFHLLFAASPSLIS